MSFFEPMPEREPPQQREWSAPLWDRPSEGTVPAEMPVNVLVHAGTDAAVALPSLSVYPNGFVINFFSLVNPHASRGGGHVSFTGTLGHARLMDGMPRVGVRFGDGRTA